MLARTCVVANLDARPKAQRFPLLSNLETDFYKMGWGVPTCDSKCVFNFQGHSGDEKYCSWNAARFQT